MLALLIAVAAVAPATEQAAIFTAAGFKKSRGQWRTDCGAPGNGPYDPGAIETYGDLNGDGRPEAVVTEGGSYCYGNTGTGFRLLSKQANGAWRKLYDSPGVAEFLKTRGVANMPDLSVGGPGFCFPVLRWNGKAYVASRFEYEGKRCKPSR
jgi:hypothetical protein